MFVKVSEGMSVWVRVRPCEREYSYMNDGVAM